MKLTMKLKQFLILTSLAIALAITIPLRNYNHPGVSSPTNRMAAIAQLPAIPANVRVRDVPVVGMTVSNMDKATQFYTNVLTFRKISDMEMSGQAVERLQGIAGAKMRVVRMQLGSEVIELTQYLKPQGRPIPLDSQSNDRWFQHIAIVVSDMDQAYRQLRQFNVKHVSIAPQTLPAYIPAAAGIRAFYFRDPDNHNLEIIYFPKGKGNPRWQTTNGKLFLGIDHTAIGIGNTATSLKFYRDLLGLKVAGESTNYGPEQERLNNVKGARLRISGLTAGAGMGVEFLDYLTPMTGRSYPADSRSNDLWHWETTMVVTDATTAADRLQRSRVRFISAGVVILPNSPLGFRKAFLVRDPDGHAIRVIER